MAASNPRAPPAEDRGGAANFFLFTRPRLGRIPVTAAAAEEGAAAQSCPPSRRVKRVIAIGIRASDRTMVRLSRGGGQRYQTYDIGSMRSR